MITHLRLLLLSVGLIALASPSLARQDPYRSKAEIPGEELYSELADEVHKLHHEELKLLQLMGDLATKQQQEEELIQKELHKSSADGSLLDDLPAENPVKTLNRLARLQAQEIQELPKPLAYQKPREEKKNNHYMSLCHFKLCNMGRKRNTRYLSFWN